MQRIESAILFSQYETDRVANSNQLALYYGIGSYVSANTRSGKWGTGALASIGNQLQKELPGLRGFSERNLKYMRTFFEEWRPLFGMVGRRPGSWGLGAGRSPRAIPSSYSTPFTTATSISARLCVRKPRYLPFRIVVWRQEIRE